MTKTPFRIDPDKKFPTLPGAPIVEAVLHWQALATEKKDENDLLALLKERFSDYEVAPQHNLNATFSGNPSGIEFKQTATWDGVRLTKRHDGQPQFICQFKPNELIFSQLKPYQNWEFFVGEAMRFWDCFVSSMQPTEVARMTTRFISQIPIDSVAQAGDFIEEVVDPIAKIGLHSQTFFHQDSVSLPGLPYTVELIRAVQADTESRRSLIVDTSVLTTEPLTRVEDVESKLRDLRCIKNEIFFTIMKNAESKFGEVA